MTAEGQLGPAVNAGAAAAPTTRTLAGRFVTLRALDPAADATALFEGTHGPDVTLVWRYLSDGPYADLRTFTAALERKAASRDPLYFSIVDNESGTAVGSAAFLRIDPPNRVIEVGSILYARRLQRTTGGTEAMYLMAREAFDGLGYRRYEWKCNAFNEPSRRAAVRLGFTFEGAFRQHMIVKGRNRDTAWYSMLDSEWPRVKAAFERWLDPSNFDSEGRQRQSLAVLRDQVSP
jgi:RimJ/RimL family protein N-acetyltransferase